MVATHLYQGEDEDELSFEKGAVIYIVPYEDPEDEVSKVVVCNYTRFHTQSMLSFKRECKNAKRNRISSLS